MKKFEYIPPSNVQISTEKLLADLKKVAQKLGKNKISQKTYTQHGAYNPTTIIRRFGSWSEALNKSDLSFVNVVNYSDEELFENFTKPIYATF